MRARLRDEHALAVGPGTLWSFALDCCDCEAISFIATAEGIKGEGIRDLMTVAVEAGPVKALGYRSPREFIAHRSISETVSDR